MHPGSAQPAVLHRIAGAEALTNTAQVRNIVLLTTATAWPQLQLNLHSIAAATQHEHNIEAKTAEG
jgi:hypothetical protein